jgi:hypothetical protein
VEVLFHVGWNCSSIAIAWRPPVPLVKPPG